jgi:lipoyl(octanoyl) transferase
MTDSPLRLPELQLWVETMPRSGVDNMAIDEALLNRAVKHSVATLRWYRWSEPTVSLGFFQHEHEVDHQRGLAPLPSVRRLTGGGALVHQHEWTYSLTIPASLAARREPYAWVELVHRACCDWIHAEFQLSARLRGETIAQSPEPLLCFLRRDAHDVVCDGHKVLGSAQRRRKGALLQHGGLLLQASPHAPELLGLCDLTPQAFSMAQAVGMSAQPAQPEISRADRRAGDRVDAQVTKTFRAQSTLIVPRWEALIDLVAHTVADHVTTISESDIDWVAWAHSQST